MTRPITIAARLHPFSHLPGIKIPLPGSLSMVECFPTLLRFYDLTASEKKIIREIALPLKGPIEDFTVELDVDRKKIGVWGKAEGKFFRYYIYSPDSIVVEKGLSPLDTSSPPFIQEKIERLSLGSHKKQEWEGIKRRIEFTEIFPLWFQWGREFLPSTPLTEKTGIFSLLKECEAVVKGGRPEKILSSFRSLFLAGFEGIMVPRLFDNEFQGILPLSAATPLSTPFYLLSEGAKLIRSLFIQQEGNQIALLPSLPPELFSGRMVNIACPPWGRVDFEWSKKTLRRLSFTAERDGLLLFHFPTSLKKFRLRRNLKERGKSLETRKGLEIKSGSTYLLDRFEK